jgi:hypothetical protein
MSLRDLVDRKAVIKDAKSGVEFEVRGLSLEDLVLLLENHKDALIRVFGGAGGGDTDFSKLIKEFPNFIAAAIAYASGEHDLEDEIMKVPVGVQLRAIQEIWELSSLDVETVGKLATSLLEGVSRLNAENLEVLKQGLPTGSAALQRAQNS